MSKRKNKQPSAAPASADAPEVTVVDGEVVGVAPGGDASTASSTDEDAILAALAGDEGHTDVTTVDAVVSEATDEVPVELDADDEDAVLAEVAAEEEDKAPAPTASKRKSAPKTPAAPAIVRQFTDVAAIDAHALKANLDGVNAKKVNEKVQNLISAIETGKKLSRYTQVAIKRLIADGKITGKSMVEAFQAENLSIGTARAQAQQMTALFKAVGLVQDNGSKELAMADANLAKELEALAA